jgi:phosphoglycolate phosphatase
MITALPALIFDLDGTLVDTAPDLLGALNAVLIAQGRSAEDTKTLRHMVGFGARSLIKQAFQAQGVALTDAQAMPLMDDFVAHYRDHIADESIPFPGVRETLQALAAGGTAMGVLTNKPQELVRPLLDALDLTQFFGAIHGAGRFEYVKPDARVFHHVVEELGGGNAVMIGDSATDVATARAANAPVILVSYGYTPTPARELGADAVTDDFRGIPALIKGLCAK